MRRRGRLSKQLLGGLEEKLKKEVLYLYPWSIRFCKQLWTWGKRDSKGSICVTLR